MKRSRYKLFKKGATVICTEDRVVYNDEDLANLNLRANQVMLSRDVPNALSHRQIRYCKIGSIHVLEEDMFRPNLGNGKLIQIKGILYYPGFFTFASPIQKRRKLTF
tara:strand:- start:458 stop:778 length:321 start_codon:yes stop_codon:yes gene_type:complete